jgi:ABC-type uncharacterized transport system auxiliary subunit
MRLRGRWFGTALALVVLLAGCVSLERSYPERRYFVFELARKNPGPERGGRGTLQLAAARVSPRYADQNFVYRRSDTRYESDYYNQFLISPSVMVTEEIRRALEDAGIFEYVVGPAHSLIATHTMDSSVNVLYGDFRDLQSPRAVLEIEFFLSREVPEPTQNRGRSASGENADLTTGIVLHKRYQRVVPVAERTPEALVQGWDKALEEIVASLIADIKATKL